MLVLRAGLPVRCARLFDWPPRVLSRLRRLHMPPLHALPLYTYAVCMHAARPAFAVQISKEVAKLREYEQGLLKAYQVGGRNGMGKGEGGRGGRRTGLLLLLLRSAMLA